MIDLNKVYKPHNSKHEKNLSKFEKKLHKLIINNKIDKYSKIPCYVLTNLLMSTIETSKEMVDSINDDKKYSGND